MTALDLTIFNNTASLIFGIGSWVLALLAIAGKTSAFRSSVISFCLCTCSLLLQLFEISNRVSTGDFSAIMDTIQAVILASCVLVAVTTALNLIALLKSGKK